MTSLLISCGARGYNISTCLNIHLFHHQVQTAIEERFSWLSLKEEPFQKVDVVQDDEIKAFQQHALKLFPGMNMAKLTKSDLKDLQSYHSWKNNNCREQHYAFQIRKRNRHQLLFTTKDSTGRAELVTDAYSGSIRRTLHPITE